MTNHPQISVIMNTGEHRIHGETALRSLLAQEMINEMEIIIVDSVEQHVPPPVGHDHPSVVYMRTEPEVLYSAALVRAINLARAPIVALLEDHCIVMPGWAAALVKAHQEPWGAVCGEIINGSPGVGISDAEFITCRPIPWHSPAERAELSIVDGHNSSYRRDLLLSYGDEALTKMLAADAVLLIQLKQDGHRLLLEPDAKYVHCNETKLSTLTVSLFYFHQTFGAMRAEVFHWNWPKRIRQVGIALLTPPYQSLRNLRYIRKKRPDLLRHYLRNLPMVLFLGYASNFGQIAGLLFGRGKSVEKATDVERKILRPLTIKLPAQIERR